MKEFVEKLIGRLEEYCKPDCDGDCSKCHFSSALGIVYELAEEYNKLDDICRKCWNDGCKARSEEFRKDKLPVCKDMIEHPENWNEERVYDDLVNSELPFG